MRDKVDEIRRRWQHFDLILEKAVMHTNLLRDAIADIKVLLDLIKKSKKKTKKK